VSGVASVPAATRWDQVIVDPADDRVKLTVDDISAR
jgi:hypothetical protein